MNPVRSLKALRTRFLGSKDMTEIDSSHSQVFPVFTKLQAFDAEILFHVQRPNQSHVNRLLDLPIVSNAPISRDLVFPYR